jgi:hypothetical protein
MNRCEHGNEPSGSIKRKIHKVLHNWHFLKKASSLLSYIGNSTPVQTVLGYKQLCSSSVRLCPYLPPPFHLTSTLVSSFPCWVGHSAPGTRLLSRCGPCYTVKTPPSTSGIKSWGFLGAKRPTSQRLVLQSRPSQVHKSVPINRKLPSEKHTPSQPDAYLHQVVTSKMSAPLILFPHGKL